MMFSTSTSLSAFKKQAGEEKETGEEREEEEREARRKFSIF